MKDLLEISIETNSEFVDQYNQVKEILLKNNFTQELYFSNRNYTNTNNFDLQDEFGNLLFKKKNKKCLII